MKSQNKTKHILMAVALTLSALAAHAQNDGSQQMPSPENPADNGRGPDAYSQPQQQPAQDNNMNGGTGENAVPGYSNQDVSNPAGYDRTKESQPQPTN
jgi:hypothetical protein